MIRKALFDNSESENPGTDHKKSIIKKNLLIICIQRRKTMPDYCWAAIF